MNELEILLGQAMQEPELRIKFYEILINSDIFVISDKAAFDIKDNLAPYGSEINIATWAKSDENKTPIVPFFSSVECLRKAIDGEATYMQLSCIDFFKIISGTSCVLNPFSEVYKEFSVKEMQILIDSYESMKEYNKAANNIDKV